MSILIDTRLLILAVSQHIAAWFALRKTLTAFGLHREADHAGSSPLRVSKGNARERFLRYHLMGSRRWRVGERVDKRCSLRASALPLRFRPALVGPCVARPFVK